MSKHLPPYDNPKPETMALFDIHSPPLWVLPLANDLYNMFLDYTENAKMSPTLDDMCNVLNESEYRTRSALYLLVEGGLIKLIQDGKEGSRYRLYEVVKTGLRTKTRLSTIRKRKLAA